MKRTLMPHVAFGMSAVVATVLLCSCGTSLNEPKSESDGKVPAPAETRTFGLHKFDDKLSVVERPTYQTTLLGQWGSMSIDLPLAAGTAPIIDKCFFIAWGDKWMRILEEAELSGLKTSLDEKPDGLVVSATKGRNKFFDYESTRSLRGDTILFEYRLTVIADVADCRRAALEINPPWDAAAGARLDVLMADGSQKTIELPKAPTKDDKYEALLAGDITSIRMTGAYGMEGAGFEITGNLAACLEQTGSRFRWHLGARGLPKALKTGDSLAFSLTLKPIPPSGKAKAERRAVEVSVDVASDGPTINPLLFGANIHMIGHGVAKPGKRHPYQKNPRLDPESAKYMRESGVTFFRAYVQHLYDTLGQCGGDITRDPICPADGAPCDYTRADPFIEAIKELNIELMPCVGLYCPPWLSTQRTSPKYSGLWMIHRAPPKDNTKWSAIIAGLVRHWNIEKKYGITFWQVGNEPNDWTRYWVGGTMPEFIEYFNTASQAMKAVDPTIKISGPDLSDLYAKAWPANTLSWKDEFVKACRPNFDDFSFNCYGTNDFTRHVKDARASLADNGAADKSLYIAEFNLTAGDYDNAAIFTFDGAFYLCKAMRSLMENKVDRASFFCWDEDSSLGLFTTKSDGTLAPKPMYHAFRLHASLGQFKSAAFLPTNSSDASVLVTACRHADGRGASVLLAANNPLVSGYDVSLNLSNLSGASPAKLYSLVPGKELEELSVKALGNTDKTPLSLQIPGRSILLLVMRK